VTACCKAFELNPESNPLVIPRPLDKASSFSSASEKAGKAKIQPMTMKRVMKVAENATPSFEGGFCAGNGKKRDAVAQSVTNCPLIANIIHASVIDLPSAPSLAVFAHLLTLKAFIFLGNIPALPAWSEPSGVLSHGPLVWLRCAKEHITIFQMTSEAPNLPVTPFQSFLLSAVHFPN
jgi:hypothetical protein